MAVGGSGGEVGATVDVAVGGAVVAVGSSEAPHAIKSDAITINPKTKRNDLSRLIYSSLTSTFKFSIKLNLKKQFSHILRVLFRSPLGLFENP